MSSVPFSCRFLRVVAFAVALPAAFATAGARAAEVDAGGASVLAPAAEHEASARGLVHTLLASLNPVRKTSGFAARRHPVKKTLHFHQGVDFAAPHGTPVRAVDDGRVTFAGRQKGFGKVVYIDHGAGERTTVYAHLSRIDVRAGDGVDRGRTIGAVGNTGIATGPHLHFEVRERGKPVDPVKWADAALRDAMASRTLVAFDESNGPARCVSLLQKFSLESLAPDELELLRRGCAE